MQLNQILDTVQERAHLDSPERSLEVIRATLETLNERLTSNESRDLGAQLPDPLKLYLGGDSASGRPYTREEFLRYIGEREGVSEDEAEQHARAVLETVGSAISTGELRDVLAQLPQDLQELFGSATNRLPS